MTKPQFTSAQTEVVRKLPERIPVGRMHTVWIFPPHLGKTRESGLVVVSFEADEAGMQGLHALVTVRYQAEVVKGSLRVEESYLEEGWAPPERIERVIAGVLARGGIETGEPVEVRIGGREERWSELLDEIGVLLDPA